MATACKICGDPIRSDNTVGICTNRDKPECFNAYASQARRNRLAAPAVPSCQICGRPLSRNNQAALCDGDGSPACRDARNALKAETRKPRVIPASERPACPVCGSKLRADNKVGVCSKTPACREEMAERRRITARKTDPATPREHPRRVPAIPAGTAFGRLTTLEESPKGDSKVRCRCSCKRRTELLVLVGNLKGGRTKSCGCLRRENAGRPRGPGGIYLPAGSVSGRLTTLEDAVKSHHRILTRCECGAETVKLAQRVKLGGAASCGTCVLRDAGRTHGLSGHPLYSIWHDIAGRTSRPTHKSYARYGAIGRTLCGGWTGMPDGFLRFAADMGPRPSLGHSVDRYPDNSGGYWCGHCEECIRLGRAPNYRWATRAEQAANKGSAVQVIRERDALAALLAEAQRPAAPRRQRPAAPAAQGALF
jgi:hypothetical protein